jgi:D-beta-D-heptose 7-phosphate kinase/D-beta-D-heptose 1-phosphate adenosyltransferase
LKPARVAVIGDVILDRYWIGDTSRISPEAPVQVVRIGGQKDRVGGAANVAHGVKALGLEVDLFGFVGDDEQARSLKNNLAEIGIRPHLLQAQGVPTTTKLRVLSPSQQLIRLDFETPVPRVDAMKIRDLVLGRINQYAALVLSDYKKGVVSSLNEAEVHALIASARDSNIPVIVDPKGTSFQRYAGATLLTPNEKELIDVIGSWEDEKDLGLKVKRLLAKLSIENLLLTRGAKGMTLFRSGRLKAESIPSEAREVFDVTGAGDTVVSVMATTLALKLPMEESIKLANKAAGISVSRAGVAVVDLFDLKLTSKLQSQTSLDRKVCKLEELTQICESFRSRGKRLVFSNGCFDLLHSGHVDLLERAKALGDVLVVGVNSDQSVRKIKSAKPGPKRPLQPLEARLKVLAALESIDFLVTFSEETPIRLILSLKPDVIIKGADYKPHNVVGFKEAQSWGGNVVCLPFHGDYSTSRLIENVMVGKSNSFSSND